MVRPQHMKKAFACIIFTIHIFLSIFSIALTDTEEAFIAGRQLLTLPEDDLPDESTYKIDAHLSFANPRLKRAYIALHAWKKAIYADPQNVTSNWDGSNVCAYTGVYCGQAVDDRPELTVVEAIDFTGYDMAGYIPAELGLFTDIKRIHINTNRFCGIIPLTISKLPILTEIDFSNNHFVGTFPMVVLDMPALKYLDLRFNEFEGALPSQLFNKELDVLKLNNNRFHSTLPDNIGNSTVSLLTLGNNFFHGCIPKSIGQMEGLVEITLMNNNFSGCLPKEISMLKRLRLFDISGNNLVGYLPTSLGGMEQLKLLNLGSNRLKGVVPKQICKLPNLLKLVISDNYFESINPECEGLQKEVEGNCIDQKVNQRTYEACHVVLSRPVKCGCTGRRRKSSKASSDQTHSTSNNIPLVSFSSLPSQPYKTSPPPPSSKPASVSYSSNPSSSPSPSYQSSVAESWITNFDVPKTQSYSPNVRTNIYAPMPLPDPKTPTYSPGPSSNVITRVYAPTPAQKPKISIYSPGPISTS